MQADDQDTTEQTGAAPSESADSVSNASFEKVGEPNKAAAEVTPKQSTYGVNADVKKDDAVGSTVETQGSIPPAPKPAEKKPEAPAKAAPAPAPAPAPAVPKDVPAPAPAAPAAGSVATLQATDADAHTLELFRQRMDEYIKAMGKGKPMDAKTGAPWQRKLFAIIDQILKLEGTVFYRAWSDLLAKVAANRDGAFHESYVQRFFPETKLEKAKLRVYQNLIHLIIHTADPKGRQQMLKMIDIASVTANLNIPGAADKLYAYYKL
jgi:hypothetical protein